MSVQLNSYARELLRLLTNLRVCNCSEDRDGYFLVSGRLWGYVDALRESGSLSREVSDRVRALIESALVNSWRGALPDSRNAGPCIPFHIALVRVRSAVKPPAQVPVNEPRPVSAPAPRFGLRLLCLLVKSRNGQARTLPIHTLHPMPPRAAIKGRWPLDHYAGLQMRETHAQRPTAEVLARCARNRQARALRPALGSVRAGGLTA